VHQTERFRRFRRVFWLHNVPAGTARGNHSLRKTTQTFIAIQGLARLTLEDAEGATCTIDLSVREPVAVIVPPNIWRTIDFVSDGAIIMVLCDLSFDESEYVENKSVWRSELER